MTRIVHNTDESRYELYLGDELAGVAEYRADGDRLIFDHTETNKKFRGRGFAATLVKAALDDVRPSGRTVVPQCWFVADFIRDHAEYQDLLVAS